MTTQTQTTIEFEWEGYTEEVAVLSHDQLVANQIQFAVWAQTAIGCDWCCGGGDLWAEKLRVQRAALGFQTWEDFVSASPTYVVPPEVDDNGDGESSNG